MDGGAWWAKVHGVAMSQIRLSDFTFTFHFHALEKEMATHSCSCLENPRDGGAWWAAVYGVTQSRTRLKSPSAIILEPKKIRSDTVSIVSPSICHEVMGPDRRRHWHPTPVLLPGESHGRRSLVGCSPWVAKSRA